MRGKNKQTIKKKLKILFKIDFDFWFNSKNDCETLIHETFTEYIYIYIYIRIFYLSYYFQEMLTRIEFFYRHMKFPIIIN